jgi:hypothetical protein
VVLQKFDHLLPLIARRPHHSQHRRNGQSIHRGNRLPLVREGSLTSVRLCDSLLTYIYYCSKHVRQIINQRLQDPIVPPNDVVRFL